MANWMPPASDFAGVNENGFIPGRSYGTPPKVLDNLMQIESSGRPAVVNQSTGATGAYQFIPGTVNALSKQGVSFNPTDPIASRSAADYYIQQLLAKNGGDLNKALAAYGGFVKADPTKYVQAAIAGYTPPTAMASAPGASSSPVVTPNVVATPIDQAQPTSDLSGELGAGVRGAYNGLTFGLGNKAQAEANDLVSSTGNLIQGNGFKPSPGQDYVSQRNEGDRLNAEAQAKYPMSYLGGNIAGGTLTGIGLTAATGGLGLGVFPGAIAAGGISGAANGAGQTAATNGDVVSNAVKGGLVGAAVSGVLGGLSSGAQKLVQSLGINSARQQASALASDGSPEAVNALNKIFGNGTPTANLKPADISYLRSQASDLSQTLANKSAIASNRISNSEMLSPGSAPLGLQGSLQSSIDNQPGMVRQIGSGIAKQVGQTLVSGGGGAGLGATYDYLTGQPINPAHLGVGAAIAAGGKIALPILGSKVANAAVNADLRNGVTGNLVGGMNKTTGGVIGGTMAAGSDAVSTINPLQAAVWTPPASDFGDPQVAPIDATQASPVQGASAPLPQPDQPEMNIVVTGAGPNDVSTPSPDAVINDPNASSPLKALAERWRKNWGQ